MTDLSRCDCMHQADVVWTVAYRHGYSVDPI